MIASERGFHVIKLRKRVPASQKPLAESRDVIWKRLSELARDQGVDDLVAGLSKTLNAEIFEQNFVKVQFDANPQVKSEPLSQARRQ